MTDHKAEAELEEQITAQGQVVDDWSSGRASWWNLHAQSDSPNRHAESAQHDLAQLQIEIAKLNDLRSRRPNPLVVAVNALVEQTRIANLIALAGLGVGLNPVMDSGAKDEWTTQAVSRLADEDTRTALGLKP